MYISINRLWHELCDMLRRLVGTTALDIMIVQFRNEKVSNHGSIPITIDCNVVAFIVLKKYGPMIPPAHEAHQTVSFSGCNGVSTYTCGLASLQMRQFYLLRCDQRRDIRLLAGNIKYRLRGSIVVPSYVVCRQRPSCSFIVGS
ncbi:hypothetical protein TNCV_4401591 [Trichonephila clavipes]|nr:hypothetical protein TNCV_4401591 [Trichonephila clavipes]